MKNLEKLPNYINDIIEKYFNCEVISKQKVGEGFYGVVYLLEIVKDPFYVILKVFKHQGRNSLEYEQLNLLRPFSILKVPEVFYIHHYTVDIPFDFLLMEYVKGINASRLPTNHPNSEKFANELVDNLIHLHSISNVNGFGNSNKMYLDWHSCYKDKINKLYKELDFHKDQVSNAFLNVVEKSYQGFDKIFCEKVEKSSLVHSDYNLWNILVDEETANITAIIDPNDAMWADQEIDLFHLQNANGDRFNLLDRYKAKVKLSHLFPVKNAFYWFWDDVKHFINTGWYNEEHFTKFGNRLLNEMDKL